jgi:hypothetical protein
MVQLAETQLLNPMLRSTFVQMHAWSVEEHADLGRRSVRHCVCKFNQYRMARAEDLKSYSA